MKRAIRAATADKDMRRVEELYAIQAADPECDKGAEYPEDDAPSEDDCYATQQDPSIEKTRGSPSGCRAACL